MCVCLCVCVCDTAQFFIYKFCIYHLLKLRGKLTQEETGVISAAFLR